MGDSLSIALSGLQANAARVGVAASNLANLRTSGKVDAPETAYQPQQTVLTAQADGGVTAAIKPVEPATETVYAPTDANADADGLVAMPNVSVEQNLVDSLMATTGYTANASVIKTLAAMDRSLLDIKA